MSELRDQLKAAMRGEEGGETTPEPVVTDTTIPADNEAAQALAATPQPAKVEAKPDAKTETKPATDAEGPKRGPDGKFAPKTDTPTAETGADAQPSDPPKTESAEPAAAGPQETEATRIPPALSAAVKAQWKELPQAVRDEFSRLEDTFAKGKAEWGSKGQRLNRYEEIIGPHADRWRASGLDEFSGLQTLIAAQNLLDRNPVDGILQIARSYGLTPAHLAQALGLPQTSAPQPGAEGHLAPTAAPDITAALQQHLSPLQQQVQTLQQQLQERDQQSEARELAKVRTEIETFAAKPENMYFENVREDIVALLQSGRATDLQDAYDKACWLNPEIRSLQLKAQADEKARTEREAAEKAKREAEDKARSKAAEAQRAGGSVTGAPAPGSQAPEAPHGNLRETLRAAMRQHAPQV